MNQSITICLTHMQKQDDIEIKIIYKCVSHFQASCIIGFYGFVLKIAESVIWSLRGITAAKEINDLQVACWMEEKPFLLPGKNLILKTFGGNP